MRRTLAMLALPWILLGCSASSDGLTASQKTAVRCAENWRKQGFEFDPNSMTCSEMWERVQATRRAAYWRGKGYIVDPNSLTWQQIDQKVQDIDRAQHWKERGYDFDPNAMTAQEMDESVQQLEQVQFWKDLGYYYDPVDQKVYLNADKKIPLASLPVPTTMGYWSSYSGSLWPSSGYSSTYSHSTSNPYRITAPSIAENGTYYGQISENTGRPKTVYVGGYFRKDGTYVRSHYRSK